MDYTTSETLVIPFAWFVHGDRVFRFNTVTGETWVLQANDSWKPVDEPAESEA